MKGKLYLKPSDYTEENKQVQLKLENKHYLPDYFLFSKMHTETLEGSVNKSIKTSALTHSVHILGVRRSIARNWEIIQANVVHLSLYPFISFMYFSLTVTVFYLMFRHLNKVASFLLIMALSLMVKNHQGLQRSLKGWSACCASMKTYIQKSITYVKAGVATSIWNLSQGNRNRIIYWVFWPRGKHPNIHV